MSHDRPAKQNTEKQVIPIPIATKEDKTRHGWGMQSVKAALEKYNGTMKCQFSETEFKITVMLFF
ncbi:GHKL domain-containing protein [Clostridiaceae bacterium]|nr:GHKL domain-containing protein [Clostridiaceae bacterium]